MVYFSLPTTANDSPAYRSKPRRRFLSLPGFSGRTSNVVIILGATAAFFVFLRLVATGSSWPAGPQPPIGDLPPNLGSPPPVVDESSAVDTPPSPSVDKVSDAPAEPLFTPSPVAYGHRPLPVIPDTMVAPLPDYYHELSLDELRSMVSRTKGYFVRDFSLGLGWNNMRYIVEASLLQASLLNRTLVLPSFAYARACEYPIHVCAAYAPMVNKGDAVGWEEWRNLPIEQQMGWRIPMSLMINITRIRERQPVILLSDYLRLHGISPDEERSNGAWHRDFYHSSPSVFEEDKTKKPSLFVVENWWYDPKSIARVDYIPADMKERGQWDPDATDSANGARGGWPAVEESHLSRKLSTELGEDAAMDYERALKVLRDLDVAGLIDFTNDKAVEERLRNNGWEVLYTFISLFGDYSKSVVQPLKQVVKRSSIRGWADEYARETADVLLLAGETHLYRKPGTMRFTTVEGRKNFQDMVLHYIVSIDAIDMLASRLVERMFAIVGNRLWMGSHMRRGDFVRIGWAMESNPNDHIRRVKERLGRGKQMLEVLKSGEFALATYDVPGVHLSDDIDTHLPPIDNQAFYVATDERDPEVLQIFRSNGALFLNDLLTIEDQREFGWPLMITDIRALVEQRILAHAGFFYAHMISSVAGGIINLRAAVGADPRTALLD